MSKISVLFFQKIVPNLTFIALGSVAVTTTGIVAFNVSKNLPPVTSVDMVSSKENPQINDSSKTKDGSSITLTGMGNVDTTNSCIVTISGNKYNVTNLKQTHSGGDIFNCNTDMTQSYINRHGNDLSRISKYLIIDATTKNSIVTTIPTTVVPTPGNSNFTLTTLSLHNTSGDCYVAYNSTVYDVSNHPSWQGCIHHGINGGSDITSRFPHSTSYFSSLPIVGQLINGSTPVNNVGGGTNSSENEGESGNKSEDEKDKGEKESHEDNENKSDD
jgi:predicted heme/steroid binding protein